MWCLPSARLPGARVSPLNCRCQCPWDSCCGEASCTQKMLQKQAAQQRPEISAPISILAILAPIKGCVGGCNFEELSCSTTEAEQRQTQTRFQGFPRTELELNRVFMEHAWMEPWLDPQHQIKRAVMVHVCNPCICAKAGGTDVQGHVWLHESLF